MAAALCRAPERGFFAGHLHVKIHARADVEGVELDGIRLGEAEAEERVEHGEGLRDLRRIVVDTLLFIDEIKAGTNDGHAADAVRLQLAGVEQRLQREVEIESGQRLLSSEMPRSSNSWLRLVLACSRSWRNSFCIRARLASRYFLSLARSAGDLSEYLSSRQRRASRRIPGWHSSRREL